jgi:hypothetical protein
MSPIRLTPSVISKTSKEAAAAGKRLTLTDERQEGLRINLMPSGRKAWYLNCRPLGSKTTDLFLLGQYETMGIADARQAARTLREKIRQGSNPKADRRRAKALGINGEVHTLRALCKAYGASDDAPGSWVHSSKRIYRVFTKLLDLPLPNLKSTDIQITADSYGARASANFAIRTLRPVLKWAAIRGYVPKGMSEIVCKQPAKRDRVLSNDELAKVLSTSRSSGSMYAKAIRFILWTMTRLNETTMPDGRMLT